MTNENTNIDLEKIKDRIAKLLRMADDAGSPNEAAIAAGRARALMDKYQLDAFSIGDRVKEEFATERGSIFFTDIPTYMSTLAVVVARYNDCQARYESHYYENTKCVMFMGYKSDVELTVQMYKRLLKAMDRLNVEYQKELGHDKPQPRLSIQFKYGAGLEISNRIRMMTVERDALTSSGGTSLVIVKTKAVDEKFGEAKYADSKAVRVVGRDEERARDAGVIRGARVEVVPSVKG